MEGCGVKLKTYKSRHQHLVDRHKFPASFQFFRKSNPSKKQRQKTLRKEEKFKKREVEMEVEEHPSDEMELGEKKEEMEDLISAVSKLSTTNSSPPCISFGRRHARGFQFLPRSVQQKPSTKTAESDR